MTRLQTSFLLVLREPRVSAFDSCLLIINLSFCREPEFRKFDFEDLFMPLQPQVMLLVLPNQQTGCIKRDYSATGRLLPRLEVA